jgi:hypothetical protein
MQRRDCRRFFSNLPRDVAAGFCVCLLRAACIRAWRQPPPGLRACIAPWYGELCRQFFAWYTPRRSLVEDLFVPYIFFFIS